MNISTSIGIYDFLNYLVIGAILSFIFIPWIPQNAATLVLWAIPCFIAGLIFHKVIESSIGKYTRNNKELILSTFRKEAQYCDKKINEPILIEKEYYRAYYSLLEKNLLGNIPELEAISSFFQDLFFIVLIYTITSSFLSLYSICNNCVSQTNIDFSLCVIYGILCTLCFLLATFLLYYIPYKKLPYRYSNCVKYIVCFSVILCIIFAAYAGAAIFNQPIHITDKISLYKKIHEIFITNFHPALILASNSITIPLDFLSLPLLPLFLLLRCITEKKIFTLVWEGYIFMCLNKKDIIN